MSTKTAAQWLEEGMAALELSHTADTLSELRGDRETAVAAFTQALALEPDHDDALYNLSLLQGGAAAAPDTNSSKQPEPATDQRCDASRVLLKNSLC